MGGNCVMVDGAFRRVRVLRFGGVVCVDVGLFVLVLVLVLRILGMWSSMQVKVEREREREGGCMDYKYLISPLYCIEDLVRGLHYSIPIFVK